MYHYHYQVPLPVNNDRLWLPGRFFEGLCSIGGVASVKGNGKGFFLSIAFPLVRITFICSSVSANFSDEEAVLRGHCRVDKSTTYS